MKVLYVCGYASERIMDVRGDHETANPAGNTKVRLIAESLVRVGHEVALLSFVSMASSRRLFFPAAADDQTPALPGVSVLYPRACAVRPWGGLGLALGAPRIARSVMRSLSPDLVLVYNADVFQSRFVDWVRTNTHVPVVLDLEDLPKPEGSGLRLLRSRLGCAAWRHTREKVDAFVLVSQELSSAIPQQARYIVVPGVVGDDLLQAAALREPPFCSDHVTIAYAGTLDAREGTDVLLTAARQLPPGFRFVFCGQGSMARAVAQAARDCPDQVTYNGLVPRSELVRLLVTSDCLIIAKPASEVVGGRVFPFKTLEYVLSGAHVVAGHLPDCGMPELTYIQRWDGRSDSLISLLTSAPQDYAAEKNVRGEARKAIADHYSVSALSHPLSEFLRSIVDSRRTTVPLR